MFSPLARGYGTWNGGIDLKGKVSKLEPVSGNGKETHRHGVTVTPHTFRSNTNYSLSSHKAGGEVVLPKTYVTRKGALLLFTSPLGDIEKTRHTTKAPKVEKLLDCSLKLNTLERLYLSALQYGDLSGYSREKCSISDQANQLFLKFLHGIDSHDLDVNTQPGGDLNIYIRDLKTRASSRLYGSKDNTNREQRSEQLQDLLQELDGLWRSKTQSSLKPETPSLSRRILSSKSLAASLKSSTYLGRADSSTTSLSSTTDVISPVILPQVTNKHVRRQRDSWVSPLRATDNLNTASPQTKTITKVPTGKISRLSSVRSGSGRRSVNSRQSQLSRSGADQDEKGSSGTGTEVKYVTAIIEDEARPEADGSDDVSGGKVLVGVGEALGEVTAGSLKASSGHRDTVAGDVSIGNVVFDGMNRENDDSIIKAVGVDLNAMLNAMPGANRNNILDDSAKQAQQLLGIYENENMEKASVASSVFEEQDIVLPSDGEETDDFNEQPEEWPTVSDHQSTQLLDQKVQGSRLLDEDDKLYTRTCKLTPRPPSVSHSSNGHISRFSGRLSEMSPDSSDLSSANVNNSGIEIFEAGSIASNKPSMGDIHDVLSKQQKQQEDEDNSYLALYHNDGTESEKSVSFVFVHDNLSSANVNNSGIEIFEAGSIASNKPSMGDIHDVLSKQQKQQEDEDNSYLALYHNDGTESEKSVSFVFVHDNSTSGSMSVGKRNIEEDLADLERRRRRNKLLYGFLYDNYEDDEDDFKEKAKEAGEKEMEFIRIIEEDSTVETRKDDSPKQKKDNAKPKKQRKRSSAEKKYVQALDITSVAPQQDKLIENLEEISEENTGPWVHPNQQFFPDGPLPKFVIPNEERVLPSHLEEMLNRRSASKSAEELEQELSQMQNIMNKEMAGASMLVDEGEEGLTEEELKLAQKLLQERVKEVSSKIFHTGKEDEGMKPNKKNGKNKSGKGKRRSKKTVEAEPLDRKKSYAIERESIREQRRLEKEGRLKEMKELQVKIMSRQIERKTRQDEAEHRVRELADEQLALQEEATAIKRDEEEARQQLATIRQTQRAERDAKRKAEQERRRQLVIVRRQKEKEMRESARQKELEMLERIGDAETRRKLIEEEEKKMEEEERLALQSLEEELNEQQLLLEEEEIRARKLEREADEEAMQRLIVEREAAERRQEELRDEEQRIRREEELQRQNILLEEQRLIEEQRLKQLEDQEKIEQEKQRLEKLQKLEEEARDEMRIEIYQKKDWAVKRREINLERRAHHDVLGYGHGLTRPWVFSYFALCPSASYNKTIDNEPFSGKGFQVSLKMKTKETAHNTQISNTESELPAIIEGGSQLHM